MRTSTILLTILFGSIMAAGACDDNPAGPSERTVQGPELSLGNGTVRSWVTLDRRDQPTAFGFTFTEGVLSGLPAGMAGVVLGLPASAPVPPFDHLTFDWMPTGHPPMGIYTVPHFDAHAYLISQAERDLMTPADPAFGAKLARAPQAAAIPAGYAGNPGGVPRMGAHWSDAGTPELNGQPFGVTYQYGFYDGRMVFVEPMFARTFLEGRGTVRRSVPVPQIVPETGFYPTSYAVSFDAASRTYTVSFEALVRRDATVGTAEAPGSNGSDMAGEDGRIKG